MLHLVSCWLVWFVQMMIKMLGILLRVLLWIFAIAAIFVFCVVVMYYLASALYWFVAWLGPEPFGR